MENNKCVISAVGRSYMERTWSAHGYIKNRQTYKCKTLITSTAFSAPWGLYCIV